jgi:hypothetical protein
MEKKHSKAKEVKVDYNQFNLINCSTNALITSYKRDGNAFLLTFDNGYVLELDSDFTSEELVKELIKKKKRVYIHFNLDIVKDRKEEK